MITIEEQIRQLRSNLADLQSGRFHHTDAARKLDGAMQADQIEKISFVLSAYDEFMRQKKPQ
ncbi:hypothetical protein ACVW1C_008100 [Bradyrhizobium sp. USDA 4011]